jgi:hypothetical protein
MKNTRTSVSVATFTEAVEGEGFLVQERVWGWGDEGTRRLGDEGTRRLGDEETGRRGDWGTGNRKAQYLAKTLAGGQCPPYSLLAKPLNH